MNGTLGLVAGGCIALVIACASSASKAPMTAAPQETTMGGAPSSPEHAQIDRLEQEITAQRDQLGLAAPRPANLGSQPGVEAMSVTPAAPHDDNACHPGTSDTCSQSCTLSNSICGNAKKICDIAQQLGPSDTYARDKCATNNETCAAAKAKCCSCQP